MKKEEKKIKDNDGYYTEINYDVIPKPGRDYKAEICPLCSQPNNVCKCKKDKT